MHAYRALLYVERLDLAEVRPTVAQVEALARTDGPLPARYENALMAITRSLSNLNSSYKFADAEPVVSYLIRLGWLASAGSDPSSPVELTELGRALLVGLRMDAPGQLHEREHATAMVLDPNNPIVYLELTRGVSQAGAGVLVDPYFKADMMEWLINATPVTRLLLDGRKGELTKVELALDGLKDVAGADRLEVRASSSDTFHDRCLVHADGTVRLLGTSVTGVGRHLTTITPLPLVATAVLVKHINKLWDKAQVVEGKPLRRPDTETTSTTSDGSSG